MNQPITVIKRKVDGAEVMRYTGKILRQSEAEVVLEAHFNRPDMIFMDTVWKLGDRFVETYYTNRWYNVFEIHDRDDDTLKGWYCNISKPATLDSLEVISYVDLALDLWVAPDGTQTVLDEDEFAALALDEKIRSRALSALEELQAIFTQKTRRGL